MTFRRLIARLDVKPPHLIKGVCLEGVRKIGDPAEFARKYYRAGVDEILYMDAVASLFQRNSLAELVEVTVGDVFVPITVGGGIRAVEDVERLLRSGADKVAVNTAAIRRPGLITEIATRFGSQCMVLSIEAKRVSEGRWEAYVDYGREKTGVDACEWAVQGASLGAGEILVTSIDREGTRKGYDLELTRAIADAVSLPVIASGGLGGPEHLTQVFEAGRADAAAVADALHYDRHSVSTLRQALEPTTFALRPKVDEARWAVEQ